MIFQGFDCYCKGESLKDLKQIRLRHNQKEIEAKVINTYARNNYHFCMVEVEGKIKHYYLSECYKPIHYENKTYSRINNMLLKHKSIWIKCLNQERIAKIEGLIYDLFGEEMEVLNIIDFCRYSKRLLKEEIELKKIVLLNLINIESLAKSIEDWLYSGAIENIQKKSKHLIILSLRSNPFKNLNIKEYKENEII